MVLLANRRFASNLVCEKQNPSPATAEREAPSTARIVVTRGSAASPDASFSVRGKLTADSRRSLALSLTLTHWTPLQHQPSSGHNVDCLSDVLTARISGPRSRVMTSAATASAFPLRPLTPMAAPSLRTSSLASPQHATDRFPRFTSYLLRTGSGTPYPEADGGLVRRSADPGLPGASLAAPPDPPAQCGTGDETCLQSCVASALGTWGDLPLATFSTRAPTPTSSAGTFASGLPLASPSAPASTLVFPGTVPWLKTIGMAHNSTSMSRAGAGTPRLPVPTRRGAPDAIAGERIMPGTPLSTSPQSQASSDFAESVGAEGDELEQDEGQGSAGAQTAEGQPRRKKTRRAGVAITRVRRMQREVRRLAEEEDSESVQRPQPQRSLLAGSQSRPVPSPSASAPVLSPRSPQPHHLHSQPMRALTSPGPSALSSTRPSSEGRHTRSDPPPAAHSRGPSAYDRTLEDGDDVVVWRPSGVGAGGSNIWAYRPDERPRGGSA
ncbi:hypothetical protein C8Q79DRAFT_721713 [Trametes meyenii]|nr:hypothetical protein C8Q79DRAFT_721713 [Trametes meyenii]